MKSMLPGAQRVGFLLHLHSIKAPPLPSKVSLLSLWGMWGILHALPSQRSWSLCCRGPPRAQLSVCMACPFKGQEVWMLTHTHTRTYTYIYMYMYICIHIYIYIYTHSTTLLHIRTICIRGVLSPRAKNYSQHLLNLSMFID